MNVAILLGDEVYLSVSIQRWFCVPLDIRGMLCYLKHDIASGIVIKANVINVEIQVGV